ncbi:MAG TPA: methylmalonyl-CoA mutase family protein [Myxococcales bacterium]|nr:methylmalonyl-CoA mutase family protein [Myxococcales bacterium]
MKTRSGIDIKPVYGPGDVGEAPPAPGEFPYTRGIHRSMYLGKLWTMRQYAGFGTPRETNQRFRYLLEQGQTGLSLALDLPTQLGLDADDPEAEGEVGKVGVSIGSLADVEELFEGIPLERVSTSMTINATAPILLAMYELAARKRGVPDERISGTVQNDLLKEFGARGAWLFPIEQSMRLACDLIEDTVQRLPRMNPISIASHYRDAGATPAEEMAYTLSAGRAYVEELVRRGLPADRFAPRLSFFFYTYTNFFEEVAKYRAGRRIWARLLRDRYGAKEPESWRLRAACVCGGHSLTRAEPLNNIARTTLETFAVACAGVQSVFTAAYDEAFAIPTELSARTALRVQQVVAYETEVAQTADPLGGSYFVESLTDEMERVVRAVMDEIESRGGMVECLRQGWVQQRIAQRAYEHQRAVEKGEVAVVGVNKFATVGDAHREPDLELEQGSPEAARDAAERVRRVKRERDGEAARAALQRLAQAAAGSANVQPHIREAVAAYCTVGEITSVLKTKFGEYQPPTKF